MIEVLLTSSILVVVILLIRFFSRGKMNLRIQYALWILVALRLLIPVNFVHSSYSVVNVIPKHIYQIEMPEENNQKSQLDSSDQENIESSKDNTDDQVSEKTNSETQKNQVQNDTSSVTTKTNSSIEKKDTTNIENTKETAESSNITNSYNTVIAESDHSKGYEKYVTILKIIWIAGMIISGMIFIGVNMNFYHRLRKTRRRLEVKDCRHPVYVVSWLETPCLFGIWKPSIYLTEKSIINEKEQAHIIAHESTHFRHLDFIWAYVRGICLVVYWFHPFVWVAAVMSRRDCELACDEGTIQKIGEKERIEYGMTLVNMLGSDQRRMILSGAISLLSGKNSGMKERILLIAKKPKNVLVVILTILIVVGVTVGVTFTGAKKTEAFQDDITPKAEAVQMTSKTGNSLEKIIKDMIVERYRSESGFPDLMNIIDVANYKSHSGEYDSSNIVHDETSFTILEKKLVSSDMVKLYVYVSYVAEYFSSDGLQKSWQEGPMILLGSGDETQGYSPQGIYWDYDRAQPIESQIEKEFDQEALERYKNENVSLQKVNHDLCEVNLATWEGSQEAKVWNSNELTLEKMLCLGNGELPYTYEQYKHFLNAKAVGENKIIFNFTYKGIELEFVVTKNEKSNHVKTKIHEKNDDLAYYAWDQGGGVEDAVQGDGNGLRFFLYTRVNDVSRFVSYQLPKGYITAMDGLFWDVSQYGRVFWEEKKKLSSNIYNGLVDATAPGGVQEWAMDHVTFKNGLFTEAHFQTEDAGGAKVTSKQELLTGTEVPTLIFDSWRANEEKKNTRSWCAVFAKENGKKAYAVFMNHKYFTKEQFIGFVRTVKFTPDAFGE